MALTEFTHYRVLSRLAQGGMGEVYLAQDLSLDRKVAIKFLLRGAEHDTASSVLLKEARAAAHLDHPFICKVYEVGDCEGQPFLAMEYVDGETLKEMLRRGTLTRSDVLRVATEVAEALHFAHRRGIVHRDLKPANVMLAADGHVKVMDFGIAKRVSLPLAAEAVTASLTTIGIPDEMAGTLEYMSPEQVRGDPVDARSDVFAFGVLLYELLTGSQLFGRSSMLETIAAILNDTPLSIAEHNSDIPPRLAHIVSRCLERDPRRRYQSLEDVRLELASLHTATRSEKPMRWYSTRRLPAAVTVVLLVAVGAIGHRWRPLPFLTSDNVLAFKERDWIIVAEFNNLTHDPVFDGSLRLALQVALAQSQYVNIYPPERIAATLQRMQRPASSRLDATLANEVAVRDNVRGVLACDIAQLGNVYSLTARLIDPKTQVAVLTHSVQAPGKEQVLGALDALATHVRARLGESLSSLSTQSRPLPQVTTSSLDALKMYSEAMRVSGRDSGNKGDELLRQALVLDPDFALAHAELGRRYYLAANRESREAAEGHLQKALALTGRLTLRERLWIQAVAEDSRGHRDRAVDAYETYLAQYPDDTRALFRLAWTNMAALGNVDAAIKGFTRVVTLAPEDSSAWVNLATAYTGKHDFQRAVPTYQKAFALNPALMLGPFVNNEYGFTLVRTGRVADAAAVFERMKEEASPPFNRAKGFRSLALLDMYLGQYAAAANQLRQAVVIDQTYGQVVSEFRDRLYLVTALEAKDPSPKAAVEWAAVEHLIETRSFSPEWLSRPIRMKARAGRLADAHRWLRLMQKTTSRTTADSSVNRDTERDWAYIDLAQAEFERAAGRTQRAIELLERVHEYLKSDESLEALAAAYAAAGRVDAAISRYQDFIANPPLGRGRPGIMAANASHPRSTLRTERTAR